MSIQLFQNLIRRKIMRIEDEQVFTKVEVHEKYAASDRNDRERLKQLYKRG
jgi:hypothetical protein